MGFKMEITDSKGRRHSSLADAIESDAKEMFDDVLADAKRAIRAQACPVHGQRPAVTRHTIGGKTELRFETCCEESRARAEAAASRVFDG